MPCHFGNFDNTAEVEYPWHWSGLGTKHRLNTKKLERVNRHVGEEGRDACRRIPTTVRHAGAHFELELLEVGAAGGDRPEPAVRHLRAAVASL